MWWSTVILMIFFGRSLTENVTNATETPSDFKLIFVHTIWRHGDRSPDGHLKNDPVDPEKWVEGGGGYGQLTVDGMAQHFILGKRLRDRYVKTGFLHDFYDSRQVYIRSTDYNRTINSAISNMFGMFFTNSSRPGIDYPDIEGWPRGFMPVPIHSTGPSSEDCVVNAFCKCRRREKVLEIAHRGDQFQKFVKSGRYLKLTNELSQLLNTTYTWENLWQIHDLLSVASIHFPDILQNQSWYSPDYYTEIDEVTRVANSFISGIYDPPMVDGMNVKREILKMRGGSLANEIATRMRTKWRGEKNPEKSDSYHRELKYYAYSTHDHTVFAILVVLGIEDIVAGPEKYGEWPDYAADILIELFYNDKDQQPYFRMLYQNNINDTFHVVTPRIKDCETKEFCELKIFEKRVREFKPDRQINDFCEEPLLKASSLYLNYNIQSSSSYWSSALIIILIIFVSCQFE